MSIDEKEAIQRAEKLLKCLQEQVKSVSVKRKLNAVRNACYYIVDSGGTPSIAGVVKWIATNSPQDMIRKQTIYNRLAGSRNPYRQLIDSWQSAAEIKQTKISTKAENELGGGIVVSKDELSAIVDPVVRHKVSLVVGQYQGLKKQLDMVRKIRDLPSISHAKLAHTVAGGAAEHALQLLDHHIEALQDFINTERRKQRHIEFSETGALKISRRLKDEIISKPGLLQAIERVIKAYTVIV